MSDRSPEGAALLPPIETEADLDEVLSRPPPVVVEQMRQPGGDLLILGVGGKMGPTLARMAKRALTEAKADRKVIGVDLFPTREAREVLKAGGIETVACDLLEPAAIKALPDAADVIFMAGTKFGSTGNEPLMWAINTYLPALVARRFRNSRIVAFSSGNVYPFTPVSSSGPTETDTPGPVGEYAQTCLGRERMFQYFSGKFGTPAAIIRLNYAIDLRYGVLLDIAERVRHRQPIDLSMGYVNVIWQGDAAAMALRAMTLCSSPPTILNVTGPEIMSVRSIATRFGELLGNKPVFEGTEAETALVSNAARCRQLFGAPAVSVEQMIHWVAHWVSTGGRTLAKPTHFETRDGKF